jgi:multicomponent Na+:H+ antiporter subunit G
MGARDLAAAVLLGLAALVVVLSGLGLLAAPRGLVRVHYLTPVTSIAGPLTGAGYVVDQGWGISPALVLLIVGLLAITGPPLSAAIGRTTAVEQDLLPEDSSS